MQDVGLRTKQDSVVLDWAAAEGRVLLTHDAQTMPAHAYERILNSLPMAGVFVVPQEESVSRMATNLLDSLPAVLSDEDEGVGEALRRDAEIDADLKQAISLARLVSQIQGRRG